MQSILRKIYPPPYIEDTKVDFDDHNNHYIQFIHFLQKFPSQYGLKIQECNLTLPYHMPFKVYPKKKVFCSLDKNVSFLLDPSSVNEQNKK